MPAAICGGPISPPAATTTSPCATIRAAIITTPSARGCWRRPGSARTGAGCAGDSFSLRGRIAALDGRSCRRRSRAHGRGQARRGEDDAFHAIAAFGIVPLRAGGNPRDPAAARNLRLPLPRLPEDVVVRLFADGDVSGRRLRGD